MNRLILPFEAKNFSSKEPITVKLPGSKYIANRLLPLCAMADSDSILSNVVSNDDINTSIEGLSALGYRFFDQNGTLKISPRLNPPNGSVIFNTHHSGTFSRFVTAIAALENVDVSIECSEKMATRPMTELFEALRGLGVQISSSNDRLPAVITGPIKNSMCDLDASRSSQYLSALLIVAPMLTNGLTINLIGKQVSNNYIEMTISLMQRMGVNIRRSDNQLVIAGKQKYHGIDYTVPCDPVSSTYFMGLAVISGQSIKFDAFDHHSLQGESKFYQVLERMGVKFEKDKNSLTIIPTKTLQGITVDMGNMPDAVQTLAAIASYAKGKTVIKNIEHLAFKESNRILDTATELRKAGINVETGDDYLIIQGGSPKACTITTYDDHRMAMSMGLLGVKTEGIVIQNSDVVNKSFPTYWQLMAESGLRSELEF